VSELSVNTSSVKSWGYSFNDIGDYAGGLGDWLSEIFNNVAGYIGGDTASQQFQDGWGPQAFQAVNFSSLIQQNATSTVGAISDSADSYQNAEDDAAAQAEELARKLRTQTQE
jgi:hypothetical protein